MVVERFKIDGYRVVRRLLRPKTAARLATDVAASLAASGAASDRQVPGSPARYADPHTETLLLRLQPRVERIAGVRVFPTYSYSRVYRRGAVLRPHTDREACEISVSLSLSCRPQRPWPLWLQTPVGDVAVSLEPGDGLVYRGIERRHWRDRFDGEECVQVFLHYVAQRGPYAAWRYDRHPGPA